MSSPWPWRLGRSCCWWWWCCCALVCGCVRPPPRAAQSSAPPAHLERASRSTIRSVALLGSRSARLALGHARTTSSSRYSWLSALAQAARATEQQLQRRVPGGGTEQRATSTSTSAAVTSKPRLGRPQKQQPARRAQKQNNSRRRRRRRPIPPFPWRSVVSILLVNLSEPLAITLLFPFAPFLVADYVPATRSACTRPAGDDVQRRGIPNLFWGRLSDRRGRKPRSPRASSAPPSASCSSVCRARWWAFGTRFLGGLFSGVGGVCRATMRDARGAPRAFPLIGWTWSVGMFAEPMVGGLLSRPADWSPRSAARCSTPRRTFAVRRRDARVRHRPRRPQPAAPPRGGAPAGARRARRGQGGGRGRG